MGTVAYECVTPREADFVRGGSEADVAMLLHCGGCIVRRGNTLRLHEASETDTTRDADTPTIAIPYVLLRFGASRRRILILLSAEDDSTTPLDDDLTQRRAS